MTEASAEVVILTEASFASGIGTGLVLVDFWAEWCAPCHALTPVLNELAAEVPNTRIAKVDVADYPAIGERFEVTSLPTLILFRDGESVKKLFGVKNKRQLLRALDEAGGNAGADEPAR